MSASPLRYQEVQGNPWPFRILVGVDVVIGLIVLTFTSLPVIVIMIPLGLLAFFAALFSRMMIVVDDEALTLAYRFGAFRRRVLLTRIESAKRIETARWDGFGLNISQDRVSYMASPGPAVFLRLVIGPTMRIGTRDPAGLIAALGVKVEM
jgi:hypothetical protein